MDSKVLEDNNSKLLKEFRPREIKAVLDQMYPDKTLGHDGMTVGFYKHYWSIVGRDVTRVIQGFFNGEDQVKEINHANLVLISKKKQPSTPKDYRPISLYNVSYKIISKVLANRLKELLSEIIDKSQSAFVQGRIIFDNIIVAHETIHSM